MQQFQEFAQRRQALMQQIKPNSLVILNAAPIAVRNNDAEYPYRQNSDFYYLTGFEEPEAIAVLLPTTSGCEFILFNRVRNRAEEIWTGFRAGQEGARQIYGAHAAYSIHEFEDRLPELLEGRESIYYTLGYDDALDKTILKFINKLHGKIRSGVQSPFAIIDVGRFIHEMRLIKSPSEIEHMKRAAEISCLGHIRAMQACQVGMYEYQLEAELTYEFLRNGARSHAYNPIVGGGANSCILHYNDNNQVIQPGSMVLIDAGCEYRNYASDITRTFPANGRFSPEQRAIYDIVLQAQLAAIKSIKPGARWSEAQDIIVKVITQGLLDLGLLQGSLDDLIAQQAYYTFYMHRSGHWLGLDVHDAGCYKVAGQWRTLEPGMALTVEPGIYISADIPGVDPKWHNIGIRIEDDVLVTAKGHEVISHGVPKTIDEIEALMRAGHKK